MKFHDMPYTRVEYDDYAAQYEAALAAFADAQDAPAQAEACRAVFALEERLSTMGSLCYIRHTVNTKDAFYSKETDYYDETNPKFEAFSQRFYQALVASPHRAGLESIFGSLMFRNAEMALKGFDERIIPDMAEENRLSTQYQKLIASAQIPFDGKTLNISQLSAYFESPDRATRKAAMEKRSEFLAAHQQELDEIYDALVKNRDRQAKALGFASYTPLGYLRMRRNSYDRAQVEAFRKLVREEIVPLVSRLRGQQRARLGLDALYFYDESLQYPSGNPRPAGTPEEILQNGQKMYRALSPETAEYFNFMMQNELFDALGRPGKAAGGYMTELPDFKSPFIFANFNGTSEDVSTLTHEAGHAFQYYLARDIYPPVYRQPTMESCEIHSMSMEFFTWPWMELFFGKDADRYRYMHLAGALTFLPYGCAVDEFQHIVYDHPELTPPERRAAWSRLEQAYLPGRDYGGDAFLAGGGLWQRQGHIYERPFYYIDYCFAQTCALEFWALMQKDRRAAWQKYLALCRLGGRDTFTGLLGQVGLETPFDPACLRTVARAAGDFMKNFDQSKLK